MERLYVVATDPKREVSIEYSSGQTDLIGAEPREVPEGCEREALQMIRETGAVKLTDKKPAPARSMMADARKGRDESTEARAEAATAPAPDPEQPKKSKRTSKK